MQTNKVIMVTKTDIQQQGDFLLNEDNSFQLHVTESDEVSYTIHGVLQVCEGGAGVGIYYLDVLKVEDDCNQSLNWLAALIDKEKLKEIIISYRPIQILIEEEEDRIGMSRVDDIQDWRV